MANETIDAHYTDIAVIRFFTRGKLGFVLPMHVLREDADLIELFIPVGTPIKTLVAADGSHIPRSTPYVERHSMRRVLGDHEWHTNDMMMIARPGDPFAVQLFWNAIAGDFNGWYVNLQEPMVRTDLGWDTGDRVLDILVHPDRSWSWKDEGELEDAVAVGRYTREQADSIRADSERVIREMIEPWAWPFNAGYELRRPIVAGGTP